MVSKPKKAAGRSAAKSGAKDPSPAQTSSSLVDGQLARYRAMRDFSKTAEPSGQAKQRENSKSKPATETEALPFVIQKHAATRLHYDFRLGDQGAELRARR
jgi:bifunctional non-homologous end joining protein LigD